MAISRNLFLAAAACSFLAAAASCGKLLPSAPSSDETLAEPLPGLTPQQLSTHLQGDEEFARIFSEADGLGPVFVSVSCESCHAGDGKGHPFTALTRFGRYDDTIWNPLLHLGGPQLQHRAITGTSPEVIPPEATAKTVLIAPEVSGLGFLEAVDDAQLLSLADPNDQNGDGITGVPNYVPAPEWFVPKPYHIPSGGMYIGRFGKKAGAIDLVQQTANAYLNDIGITSDFNMQDLFNLQNGANSGDRVPDPEVSAATVHNVAFYVRTLKAPPRRDINNPDVAAGEKIFNQIGCASCHIPALKTGKSEIEALNNKTFYPYTDLLLHDMGSDLADICLGLATPSEFRTEPLMGLRLVQRFMHDGRAGSIEEAIRLHAGEAAASRERFDALPEADRKALLEFLKSL